ncbi:MAG: hypothetical protein RLZZ271_1338, partial [Pseudomonadota bacterium]
RAYRERPSNKSQPKHTAQELWNYLQSHVPQKN